MINQVWRNPAHKARARHTRKWRPLYSDVPNLPRPKIQAAPSTGSTELLVPSKKAHLPGQCWTEAGGTCGGSPRCSPLRCPGDACPWFLSPKKGLITNLLLWAVNYRLTTFGGQKKKDSIKAPISVDEKESFTNNDPACSEYLLY